MKCPCKNPNCGFKAALAAIELDTVPGPVREIAEAFMAAEDVDKWWTTPGITGVTPQAAMTDAIERLDLVALSEALQYALAPQSLLWSNAKREAAQA